MSDFEKDPDETLSLSWDLSDDCGLQSTTVSSATFVVPTGITKASQSNTTLVVVGVFTGGTPGRRYRIVCRVTFANGEVRDYGKTVLVKEN